MLNALSVDVEEYFHAEIFRNATHGGTGRRFESRVEASVPVLRRIALRLHVDALQSLTSSQFLVDEMPVWTSKPRELWLGAGVMAAF